MIPASTIASNLKHTYGFVMVQLMDACESAPVMITSCSMYMWYHPCPGFTLIKNLSNLIFVMASSWSIWYFYSRDVISSIIHMFLAYTLVLIGSYAWFMLAATLSVISVNHVYCIYNAIPSVFTPIMYAAPVSCIYNDIPSVLIPNPCMLSLFHVCAVTLYMLFWFLLMFSL